MSAIKSSEIIFTARLPALNKLVHLTRGAWYGHIMKRHFAEMENRKDAVKKAIEKTADPKLLKRFLYEDLQTFFIDYPCFYFKPAHAFLRVVILDGKDGIIKTAFPVTEEAKLGVVNYVC